MSFTNDDIQKLILIVEKLYEHILTGDIPEDAPYQSRLSSEEPYALGHQGYEKWYLDLLRTVFTNPHVAHVWSEDRIKDQAHELLHDLAESKFRGGPRPDFTNLIADWVKGIVIQFEERQYYVPVIGLTLGEPLTLGEVTFLPLESAKHDLAEAAGPTFFDDLFAHRDCIASATIAAESRRATELLRSKTEYALNVLRYVGSLVWHDQPLRHIYVAGKERKRVSWALSISPDGTLSRIGDTEFFPVPFKVDNQFVQVANSYGLSHLQSLVASESPASLERNLLTAIQWFGDAAQELVELSSFVKFYIAIEAATKLTSERAKSVLPRRISVLLEPWDRIRQSELETDIGIIVDERNAVFHAGKPEELNEETLAWRARIIARGTLNRLRQIIDSDGLQTKDDLIRWVKSQDTWSPA